MVQSHVCFQLHHRSINLAEGGRNRTPGCSQLHLFSRQGLCPRQNHPPKINTDMKHMQDVKKILLIDDDSFVHKIVGAILSAHGYDIMCANDVDAISVAESFMPDLILLDYLMPHKDGVAILTGLRNRRLTAETPVIFLTGKDDKAHADFFMSQGAIGVISKSIPPLEFVDGIHIIYNKFYDRPEHWLDRLVNKLVSWLFPE